MRKYLKPNLSINLFDVKENYCEDLASLGAEITTDFGLNYGTEDEYVRGM